MDEKTRDTRRDALKKAGKFVIPTMVIFQLSALKVAASGFQNIGDVTPQTQ